MNMKRKVFIALTTLTSFLVISNSLFAEKTVKDRIAAQFTVKKDICAVIKNLIWEGVNAKEVTKAGIEIGYDACLVIKCAIEGYGNVEQVIAGAIESGVSPDIISRCAIDAGAKPDEVARILAGPTAIPINLPIGEPGGGYLSPSTP